MSSSVRVYTLNIEKVRGADCGRFSALFPARYERAMKYKFEDDRLRSLAAGCLVYGLVSRNERSLLTGEFGKPFIPGGPAFSLSHSGDYAVLALGGSAVGVDIEERNPRRTDVAKRVLTAEELEWMQAEPEVRFRTLWTLKESVSKAVGRGLGLDFRSFSVLPLTRGEPVEIEGLRLFGASQSLGGCTVSVVSDEKPEVDFPLIPFDISSIS